MAELWRPRRGRMMPRGPGKGRAVTPVGLLAGGELCWAGLSTSS